MGHLTARSGTPIEKGETVKRISGAISLLVLFAVGCDGASPGSQVAEPLVQDSAASTSLEWLEPGSFPPGLS
jgi:hypothetical protein